MEKEQSCKGVKRDGRECIQKFNIKLKSKPKDGVILQLHHTVKGPRGKSRRIRFTTGAFNDVKEKLACSDSAGNVFVLDFIHLKFWKLSNIGPCSALHFFPNKCHVLTVATTRKYYSIKFIHVESGRTLHCLTGHKAPVKHISFSNNFKINNLLTASHTEAILWELKNYTKFFTLSTYLAAPIQHIMFTPSGEYVVACFKNDTIQIWKHECMTSVKQIIPSDMKHLKCIALTMNGRAMAMVGSVPTLIIFSMDTWTGLKSIDMSKYQIMGATQVAFIPQLFDGGSNRILAILSSDKILHLFDLESLSVIHTIHPETSGIREFVVSPTGKYFLCVLELGEVNIYNSSYVMDSLALSKTLENKHEPESSRCFSLEFQESECAVEQKTRVNMDSTRLKKILLEYGEYPDRFRSVIWKSLLDTPRNKVAYSALVEKGIHPAYKDIEKQFTIHSTVTLKNLKRLLSCLAHWCPLFCVMKFLPGFVFPFVKVLQKDPLLLFECVATVLLNFCQLWFEYAPFPPISVLAIVENILAQHDQQLLSHFCQVGVTSQTYALKILETAFSEVLTCSEWLVLWDHILSNEPAFILMAVVSYNIVEKNLIKKLKTVEEIENFYHVQNPIDKKTLIKNCYLYLSKTPPDIHPRRFLKPFLCLQKGYTYQPFTGYPKATICLKLARKNIKISKNNDVDTFHDLASKSLELERRRVNLKTMREGSTSKSESDDLNSLEECSIGNYTKPNHSRKVIYKEDSFRNETKEELIESIIYPTTIQLHRHKKVGIPSTLAKRGKELSKHVRSKIKKKSDERKSGSLEKELKNLIRSNSDSDV